MTHLKVLAAASLALICGSFPVLANAALPAPTAAQAEAAAAKKAQAAAEADKAQKELLATMDAVAARWRARAAAQGRQVHAPVSVAQQRSAITAPTRQTSSSGQPEGRLGPAAREAPMRSEKSGTAPPSRDVKPGPSQPYKR
jgi:hypothetical protein